jgi:hypothetical protein
MRAAQRRRRAHRQAFRARNAIRHRRTPRRPRLRLPTRDRGSRAQPVSHNLRRQARLRGAFATFAALRTGATRVIGIVNPRLARSIVTLYSRRWQRRYGDEFVALLESLPSTASNVIDACLPALGRQAQRVATGLLIAACAAISAAGVVRYVSPDALVAWHAARRVTLAQTLSRPLPKIDHSAYADWRRCLD